MKTALGKLLEKKGSQVYVTSPLRTVLDAVKMMNEKKVGALLVVEGGQPVGIFTERDALLRVLAEEADPSTTHVADVMTKSLAVVCPDTTVEQAMAVCTEKRCRHLPVMEGDEMLGVVSIGDLTHWLVRSQGHEIDSLVRYIAGQYPG